MSTPVKSGSVTRVKGIYAHLDCMLTGIEKLKAEGLTGFQVLSPLPRHEILEAVYEGRPSPVRWWTLTGGVTGITIGFLLTSLTAIQWPMINPGGKPNVPLPPYAVIMFECTILLGALFTGMGMMVHTGLPGFWLDKALQDPRVSDDKFGIVFLRASEKDVERIQSILRASGAIEVTSGDDTVYEVPNA
ncbi:MAG: DUF3341 domain-containing protein [Alphaproteobacteria bacterium]|nr:DUF3341 domain-containing protein [Alphaproteobacteria bacterium]